MSRTHLNILVQLAKVDGVIVQDEIDLIKQIGAANGMNSVEISQCFDDPDLIENLDTLTDDEKYEFNFVDLSYKFNFCWYVKCCICTR